MSAAAYLKRAGMISRLPHEAPKTAPPTASTVGRVAAGGAGAAPAPVMLDVRDDAKTAVIQSAYDYVTDPAAMIGLLYRTRSLYDACPPGVPSSELGRNRHGADFQIPEHFNHPLGMKSMNAMLRYCYNFFNDFTRKMNFNDYDACSERGNVIFFRARDVRNAIASVFATLCDSASKTKEKAAQSMFNSIKDCITSLPPTPAERERERERLREIDRRRAEAAAAEEARRAEHEARTKKAASDAFAAANGGLRPEDCW